MKLLPACSVAWLQGDQIGRIFAYWAIVDFGQFKNKLQELPNFFGYLLFSTE
jgi:hypothetical protein